MKLIDKLPYFYDNGYTRPIIEAEQVEADILYREIAETLKQCFVETATWGLDYWEDMLFLPRGTGKTYDERRSIIYTRMRATRTTTVEVVKELTSAFFGPKNVIITEHNENYYFNIEFENIEVDTVKLQDVINVIEIYKPAHLNYGFTFSVKTNIQINSDEKTGYSILPICNTFRTGTWWKMYADGISNKGKVIQAKTYDGYSYLPVCGIHKCKIISSGGTPVEPIQLTLASTMTCTKDVAFDITYSTNVEATKHELSMDGGNSYFQIYPTSNGTSYTYSHEAINDTTWNPVSRSIRVTDANGNTATGTISITIVESEPETPTSYTITTQLTHCKCSNTATSITPNSSYSAKITANSGYKLSSITVTMGGTNITSSAVSGNTISISNVTGNIVITANATAIVVVEPIRLNLASSMSCNKGEAFSITYSTNVEATKHELSMDGGSSYFQIYPTSNGTSYTYSHDAINDTTWNPVSRSIRVTDANGNTATGTISITIVESEPEIPTNYTITPQLTHCTCSNTATSITPNSSYSTTIRANSGYTLNSITVTMGGTNITSSAVSGNAVSISKVTGNVVITATVADYSSGNTTTITFNLTNCISINAATTALMGEGYTTTIVAKAGYTLGTIKVTLGGEDVSSAVVKEDSSISIGFLRGPLVITASATGDSTTVQE